MKSANLKTNKINTVIYKKKTSKKSFTDLRLMMMCRAILMDPMILWSHLQQVVNSLLTSWYSKFQKSDLLLQIPPNCNRPRARRFKNSLLVNTQNQYATTRAHLFANLVINHFVCSILRMQSTIVH